MTATALFAFLENHVGLLTWAILAGIFMVLYLRGQAQGFWPFLRETLSERDPTTGNLTASTKRMGLLTSQWAVLWAWSKLTLAVCRWIDKGGDPNTIYITLCLGVLGLAGATYLGGKWLAGKVPGLPTALDPTDPTKN